MHLLRSLQSALPVGRTVCEVKDRQENCADTHVNMCHILFLQEASLKSSLEENKLSFF